jgi:hypothetical protein
LLSSRYGPTTYAIVILDLDGGFPLGSYRLCGFASRFPMKWSMSLLFLQEFNKFVA